MSTYNILWIDDDWEHISDKNSQSFNQLNGLKEKIEHNNNGVSITTRITIADALADYAIDKRDAYHLFIIDLQFHTEKGDKSYDNIFDLANDRNIPVIIFSNYVHTLNYNDVKSRIKHLFIGIFDKDKQKENLFFECVSSIIRFKPVNIVHISDFHYDSTLIGNQKEEQITRFKELIKTLQIENEASTIDLIIFTGDIANKCPSNDFDDCLPIVQELVLKTTNNYSKILMIPGNHDIEWEDFANSKISSRPSMAFYNFIKKLYNQDEEVLSYLIGFNPKNETFDDHYLPDSLSWSKNFPSLNLEILGLNSVTTTAKLKGQGLISNGTKQFIIKQWSSPPLSNRVRIALLHHNILPPFSTNTLDESENIVNSGEVIELLSSNSCNLILSGHCHDSYLYNFEYSNLQHEGFSSMNHISYVSTGTTGGFNSSFDRARSFNVIKLLPSKLPNEKNLLLQPYIYDSKQKKWIKIGKLNSVIK